MMQGFSPETQAAFRELFAAIEKQYGPIESVHFCTSFEGSPEWNRMMEEHTREYPHPDACLCDDCAAFRYAVTGEAD